MSFRSALVLLPCGSYRKEIFQRLKPLDEFKIIRSYHEFGDMEHTNLNNKQFVSYKGTDLFIVTHTNPLKFRAFRDNEILDDPYTFQGGNKPGAEDIFFNGKWISIEEYIYGPKPVEHIKIEIVMSNIKCDCGAEKCRTTHAHWCSKMKDK